MPRDFHNQPYQHPVEPQRGGRQPTPTAPGLGDSFSMQPDPNMSQHQRHTSKQQTPYWMSTAGLDLGWMHLAIRRFNTKATAISLTNPAQRPMSDAPSHVPLCLALMLAPATVEMVADHGQVKGDWPILGTAPGGRCPIATGALSHGISPGGSIGMRWRLASLDGGHHQRRFSFHHSSDDLDTRATSIEQPEFDLDAQGVQVLEKTIEHLIHRHLGSEPTTGQGIAFATDPGIGGGVGETGRGAWFGFALADLMRRRFLTGAMRGPFNPITGDPASSSAQTLGDQTSQPDVEGLFELIQVRELGGEFAPHGLSSGSAAKVLAGLVNGHFGSSGEDPSMEEVSDLDLLATGHQR
jgi:hypothetical protein